MWTRGLIAIVILALSSAYGLWWWQNRSLTGTESLLVEKLEAATAHNPPRAEAIVDAFNLPEECGQNPCFFEDGNIGDLSFSSGNLRPRGQELIFVLEEFGGSCVRTARVQSHFGTQDPEQMCSHGGCWARSAQFPWGILSFGVDEPRSKCISSLVINSEAVFRPSR